MLSSCWWCWQGWWWCYGWWWVLWTCQYLMVNGRGNVCYLGWMNDFYKDLEAWRCGWWKKQPPPHFPPTITKQGWPLSVGQVDEKPLKTILWTEGGTVMSISKTTKTKNPLPRHMQLRHEFWGFQQKNVNKSLIKMKERKQMQYFWFKTADLVRTTQQKYPTLW